MSRIHFLPCYDAGMDWHDVAIGILVETGRILICRRRPGKPLGGLWEFPGGKCEPGEPPRAAVVRELREELGIDVLVGTPLPVIEHTYADFGVRLHPFYCTSERASLARPIGCDELRWVSPAELDQYPFPEANKTLLETLKQSRSPGPWDRPPQ